jgi:hypothetical protein
MQDAAGRRWRVVLAGEDSERKIPKWVEKWNFWVVVHRKQRERERQIGKIESESY